MPGTNQRVAIVADSRDHDDGESVMVRLEEGARLSGLGTTKFRELVNAGEVPGVVRFGRSVRLHRPTLLGWLREQAQANAA